MISNFVEISPMSGRTVYQHRVDFEPNIESISLRRKIIRNSIFQQVFDSNLRNDGVSDSRSSDMLTEELTEIVVPQHSSDIPTLKVKLLRTGQIEWGSMEMLRLYNMGMRECLQILGFFQVQHGVYVNQNINTQIGDRDLTILRGYNTSVNIQIN